MQTHSAWLNRSGSWKKAILSPCAAVVLAGLAAGSAGGQGIPAAYTLVELDPLAGGVVSEAAAINDAGQIVGVSIDATGTMRAVMWDRVQAATALEVPTDAAGSWALDLNNEGSVLLGLEGGAAERMIRWADGELLSLPEPGGPVEVDWCSMDSINAMGHVAAVAISDPNNAEGNDLVLLWGRFGNEYSIVFTEHVDPPGRFASVENAYLSDSGILYGGGGGSTSSDTRAWSLDSRSLIVLDLGTSPIDPDADVVDVEVASGSGYASIYMGVASFYQLRMRLPDGQNLPVSLLQCPEGMAEDCMFYVMDRYEHYVRGLTEWGVAVGISPRVVFDDTGLPAADPRGPAAFIWSESDGTVELATLIKDGTADGWNLREATGINEAGWVVGHGTSPTGEARGFLLIPRTPCAADANRDGLVSPADFGAWVAAYNNGCD